MATPVQSIQHTTSVSLLQLSAEIRNLIYEFALEPCTIDLLPIVHPHAAKRVRRTKETGSFAAERACQTNERLVGPLNWVTQRRKPLGLTQVCRQLRAEFLPLHQNAVEIVICCGYLVERYIRDFFPILAKANGSLDVAVRRNRRKFDIAPLMRLSYAASQFRISVHHYLSVSSWRVCSVHLVVDLLGNETWRKYFEEAVVSVEYAEHLAGGKWLYIGVRAAAAEDWMARFPEADGEENEVVGLEEQPDEKWAQAAEEWRCRVGLAHYKLPLKQILVTVVPETIRSDGKCDASPGGGELKYICLGQEDWRTKLLHDNSDGDLCMEDWRLLDES